MTSAYAPRGYSLFANDFGLTGREIDELDLDATDTARLLHMHYRHRDYSPQTGRFMQNDIFGMQPEWKVIFYPLLQYRDSSNLCEYVRSNSISRRDPYGDKSWEQECIDDCAARRDDSMNMAKWFYDKAVKGIDLANQKCHEGCDSAFPPGCPGPNDPADANAACHFACEAAGGVAKAAAYAEYTGVLGTLWGQYGLCYGACKLLF
jgi:RHS repeat-associated protein